MDNAVDALKIAFALFVFVVAITVSFSYISQAKSTADYIVFYRDETNFYNHLKSKERNRIVLSSDVISTLYRFDDESLCVTVDLGSEDKTYKFDTSLSNFNNASEAELKKFKKADVLSSVAFPVSDEGIDEMVNNFVEKVLPKDAKFTEEFVEVPIDGIIETGEDGTELPLTSITRKIYITYKLYV